MQIKSKATIRPFVSYITIAVIVIFTLIAGTISGGWFVSTSYYSTYYWHYCSYGQDDTNGYVQNNIPQGNVLEILSLLEYLRHLFVLIITFDIYNLNQYLFMKKINGKSKNDLLGGNKFTLFITLAIFYISILFTFRDELSSMQQLHQLIKFEAFNLVVFILVYFELYVVLEIISKTMNFVQNKDNVNSFNFISRIKIRLILILFSLLIYCVVASIVKISCDNRAQWPLLYLSYPSWLIFAIVLANLYELYKEDP